MVCIFSVNFLDTNKVSLQFSHLDDDDLRSIAVNVNSFSNFHIFQFCQKGGKMITSLWQQAGLRTRDPATSISTPSLIINKGRFWKRKKNVIKFANKFKILIFQCKPSYISIWSKYVLNNILVRNFVLMD